MEDLTTEMTRETFEELASRGRSAWKMMMHYITSKLWAKDDPYRIAQIYRWNAEWNRINQQIRDGKYLKK